MEVRDETDRKATGDTDSLIVPYTAALGTSDSASRRCNSVINAGGNGSEWYVGGQYKIGVATLVVQGGC